ncbi:MAG: sulfite exporter TauE/SafE family protein, partial [Spirochaetales bacterium]|nr:sulfite exporter TauE/SafE family protein [Candidatus Physcosoma equi]
MSVILRYRRHIRIRVVLPLMFPALLFSALGASVSSRLDVSRLRLILGVLFIFLSFYFYFLSSRIKLSPTPAVGIVVGTISGSMNGLFSMGGPPAVLYLAPALEKKEEYLATSQAFFITSNLMSLAVRLCSGVVDVSVLPYLAAGIPAAIAGTFLGNRL